ncbi:hypothetical protein [Mesorhizobium sp. M7A.F.Ca.ET.027.03.2.1]|uniref:hypothetical protein n=1 Tax=Mesorhizobium sp. M7A.F.Ca.ET.027.03.2.1 TaxID=2496656 RepID=UPI000FCB3784|nr:hypothetical protein [Mesorhizobium sp. M7A.F.Ca.ET.027.03.2.1]RVD64209.1 hypothetical protein EN750_13780 [Mesorhizobium sp. M7A.F.Ca.ET.027.03.2.1]
MFRVVCCAAFVGVAISPTFAKDTTDPKIISFCQERWGDDYVMQQDCRKSQQDALISAFATKMAAENSPTITKIIRLCRQRWGDKQGRTDWVMVNDCTESQAKAYYEMNLAK